MENSKPKYESSEGEKPRCPQYFPAQQCKLDAGHEGVHHSEDVVVGQQDVWDAAIEIVKHQNILNDDILYGNSDAAIAHNVERSLRERIIDALVAARDATPTPVGYEPESAAQLASGWQPIKTAPRDATPILVGLISDDKVWRASDAKFYGVGFYTIHGGVSCHWATHWMPLPALPTIPDKQDEADQADQADQG
jgi:hypothetical protein